ncbi:MAG: competence/damage-inducible protein A [Myxococcales bacterium]|nr:competence/damage-inducible protein A [Myxococcales bacterium]
MTTRTAAHLVIGNELLSGKIQDANTLTLANTLRPLGIALRRVVVVPDEVALIAAEANALRATHDYVFTSGGVGPTHDDVTVEALAHALGRRVVRSPEIESLLRAHYGDALTDGHLCMANIVEGTRLHSGLDPKWPTMVLGNVFVLPGVPEIYRYKLDGLLGLLRGDDAPFVTHRVYLDRDEGALKPYLDAVVQAFADVAVGSYPRWRDPEYSVMVTFDGRDEARVIAALQHFVAAVPEGSVLRTS